MKSIATAAAALLASAAFAAAPAHSAAPPPAAQPAANPNAIKTHTPKISSAAGKSVMALQKAVNAKDSAAIPQALAAAQADAKTADDHYVVAILQLKAAADSNNQAGEASAIEAMLASGSVKEDEKFGLYLHLAEIYSGLKQVSRATQAYQQALQINPGSVDAMAGVAEAKIAEGKTSEGLAMLQKGIALQSAGGARADEKWYKRAVGVAYGAKSPEALTLSREWVQAYPSNSSWTNALAIYQNMKTLDSSQKLDLMRLKRATGSLTPSDYFRYGETAIEKGYSGEAKSVLEQGFAAKLIDRTDPSYSQIYALAAKKSIGDREGLPTSPKAGTPAQQILNTGDAWYGYGDFAKAAEFDRSALAMSGADSNVVNLHLGMALARQGDKAGAIAALNAAGGAQAELAKYWLTYASTKA